MEIIKNIQIDGSRDKPILLDLYFKDNSAPKPVVVFVHGFKGFKDWGIFNRVGQYFVNKGYAFIKFNFSYNGTTAAKPEEFGDLEAFGQNNFSTELDDLGLVLNWIEETPLFIKDLERLFLVGHSRGGGIAILKANEDKRVAKLCTWASVNDFAYSWSPDRIEQWQKDGVLHIQNARTKQVMPLYYQLYEDHVNNRERLDILNAVKQLKSPLMVIHGTEDEAVPFEHAIQMKRLNQDIKLDLIPNANHTFGGKHPYTEQNLPYDLTIVLDHTHEFFK